MKKIPPNTYFPIGRAADLLEIETNDLLLMGATGAIHLGVILDGIPCVLACLIHEGSGAEAEVIQDTNRCRNSLFYLIDPMLYEGQEKENHGVRYNTGLASGMWHLNSGTINGILRYGSSAIGPMLTASYDCVDSDNSDDAESILLGEAHHFDLPTDIFTNLEETKNEIMLQDEEIITLDSIYISRAWLLHIRDCIDNCTAINPRYHSLLKTTGNGVVEIQEHGNTKRFSQNRENCLMALVFTRNTFPDECKNARGIDTNDAWANATINHWVSVGAGYSEPSIDYLKKIISDMHRKPTDRTTAGKPKQSDTKN
ncbi:Uncharacterised protein [Enterobacter hormaechei]|uniref:hypothetical protein n=1 Tax=Enterobacter hormaechei TaxID=158836 RepID=UPI001253E244|nr:hypothetical protein [Enterobacter hormaechei]VAL48865.1 Uncharacterised protein [Enterobacter hormaechei]